jgi:hypothetical protein
MATINKIDSTFSAKDISSAVSVYEYTANGTYKVRFQVQLTSLDGDGDYSIWLTLNDGDAVADNVIHPKTTVTLSDATQSIWLVSGEVDVMSGDVINVFALGLAGDTSVAGIVRVFSDDMTGVTLADDAITASKFDESTAFPVKSADTGTTQLARTGADSDTLETLSDQMDGIATWSAAAINASYSAGAISQIRGNTWGFDADNLTLDDTLIQLVIKNNANDQDDDAILMIDNVTGLLRVNGAAGTAGDASLAYAGTTLTVEVAASVTALLPAGVYHYGIQSIDGSGVVSEVYGGIFTVTADIVRATD